MVSLAIWIVSTVIVVVTVVLGAAFVFTLVRRIVRFLCFCVHEARKPKSPGRLEPWEITERACKRRFPDNAFNLGFGAERK